MNSVKSARNCRDLRCRESHPSGERLSRLVRDHLFFSTRRKWIGNKNNHICTRMKCHNRHKLYRWGTESKKGFQYDNMRLWQYQIKQTFLHSCNRYIHLEPTHLILLSRRKLKIFFICNCVLITMF